jgi:hypothetical protein
MNTAIYAVFAMGLVTVGALCLAAYLAIMLVRQHEGQDQLILEMARDFAQERSELCSRIQRPEMVPPGPKDRQRIIDRQQREAIQRQQLAAVGTVSHTKPEE